MGKRDGILRKEVRRVIICFLCWRDGKVPCSISWFLFRSLSWLPSLAKGRAVVVTKERLSPQQLGRFRRDATGPSSSSSRGAWGNSTGDGACISSCLVLSSVLEHNHTSLVLTSFLHILHSRRQHGQEHPGPVSQDIDTILPRRVTAADLQLRLPFAPARER